MPIAEEIGAGLRGHATNIHRSEGKRLTVDSEAGILVAQSGSDDSEVVLTSSAALVADAAGVLIYKSTEAVTAAGLEIKANKTSDVLIQGEIYVITEEAVNINDDVFARITASGGNTIIGAFRTDADTATAVQVTKARWAESTSGAGIAKLRVAFWA